MSFEGNGFKYEMIENLRNLNRFINSFIISYDSLKGECKLNDLLCVELLKMKYLSIYNLLVKNHNRFIREHQHNFHEDATLRLFGRTITDNGKEEENILESKFKENRNPNSKEYFKLFKKKKKKN